MTSKVLSSTQISKTKARFVEVTAVPGAGKTHTLIQRVHHLRQTRVPSNEIVVLSFSKATVAEIRTRMKHVSHHPADVAERQDHRGCADTNMLDIEVQTAHSFALQYIRRKKVLSDDGANKLLAKAIKATQQDCRKGTLWKHVSQKIKHRRLEKLAVLAESQNLLYVRKFLDVVRSSGNTERQCSRLSQFADLVPYVHVLPAVQGQYTAIKKKCGAIDYGDMLSLATTAISNGAPVPYTHILVDEYQDCSAAQVQLLVQLAKPDGRSIMVFGDPNQAIYGFGGSSYTPLDSVLDGVTKLRLPSSRRLHSQNAALASAIAQLSTEHAIQTSRDGEMPVLVRTDTETEQIKRVASDINHLIDGGVPPEQIVVLARTKALLHPIEQTLLARGVLTSRNGTVRDLKHVLCVLRLVDLVGRCEKRGTAVTPETLKKAFMWSAEIEDSLLKIASVALKKVLPVPSLEGRYRLCAKVYLRLLGGIRKDADRRADVNRWEPVCRSYGSAKEMRDALLAMDKRAVLTGTIHSVKGGEWDHVHIVGVTDGYIPFYKASDDQLSLSEERRLLYVAVTRSRETVRLYHSPAIHAKSRKYFDEPSRFLDQRVLETLLVE